MIFHFLHSFLRIFRETTLRVSRMSLQRSDFSSIHRGRLALSYLRQMFRSEPQLPLLTLRYRSLKPKAPVSPIRVSSRIPAILAVLVPAVLLVTLALVRHSHHPVPTQGTVSSLATNWQSSLDLSSDVSRRPVFPYSVIPGGVRDPQELRAAVSRDPIVAEHYSDFHLAKARTIRLERTTAMYVSYRLHNRVYWTHKRMVIPAGETLISDGENLARVRCGNRLSAIAAKPVSLAEPPTEKLETPESIPPLLAELLPGEGVGENPPPFAMPPLPLIPSGPSGSPGVDGPGVFPPILPPGVPPLGSNPVNPPPVSTPEPGSWQLLLAGAFFCSIVAVLRRK